MAKYSIDLETVSMVQKHTEIVTIFQWTVNSYTGTMERIQTMYSKTCSKYECIE